MVTCLEKGRSALPPQEGLRLAVLRGCRFPALALVERPEVARAPVVLAVEDVVDPRLEVRPAQPPGGTSGALPRCAAGGAARAVVVPEEHAPGVRAAPPAAQRWSETEVPPGG